VRGWEGTQPGQLTPTDQRDIPYHITSRSAIKAGGKKEERRTFMIVAFVLPNNHYACSGPAFQEASGHQPTGGNK